ncbi:SRPBCC family protein [Geodermatophilus sp. SYSU D00691]
MRELLDEIAAAHRAVARRGSGDDEEVAVRLSRSYDADVEDVWDAITDPERLRRWFAPVGGRLRQGGEFQVEGNVGGEIRRCEPPRQLTVTWGGPTSVVDVRLRADGDRTALELEHTVPLAIAQSGAGALFVAPGWEIGFLALGRHLAGAVVDDPAAWESTPEVQRSAAAAIEAWVEVVGASGTASADEIGMLAEMARAQFAPVLGTDGA